MVEFSHKKQLSTQDNVASVVNDMQDSIGVIVSQLNSLPSSKMILVTGVALSTTATPVAHNFGYIARGFFVVDKTSSVDVYRSTTATIDDRRYINLRTNSGTATVSLIIF